MLLRFVLYRVLLKDIHLRIFADVLFVIEIKFWQGTWLGRRQLFECATNILVQGISKLAPTLAGLGDRPHRILNCKLLRIRALLTSFPMLRSWSEHTGLGGFLI